MLEEEGFQYTIRISANKVLVARIRHLLTRPVGRPSHKPKVFDESFSYMVVDHDTDKSDPHQSEGHSARTGM